MDSHNKKNKTKTGANDSTLPKKGTLLKFTRYMIVSNAEKRGYKNCFVFNEGDVVMFLSKGKSHGKRGHGSYPGRECEFKFLHDGKIITVLLSERAFERKLKACI